MSALTPSFKITNGNKIHLDNLNATAIVPINTEEEGVDRSDNKALAYRVAHWWAISEDQRPKIKQLLAVQTGSDKILGIWKVDPQGGWDENPSGDKTVAVPLGSAEDNVIDDSVTLFYQGEKQINAGVIYSRDIGPEES